MAGEKEIVQLGYVDEVSYELWSFVRIEEEDKFLKMVLKLLTPFYKISYELAQCFVWIEEEKQKFRKQPLTFRMFGNFDILGYSSYVWGTKGKNCRK